MNTDTAKLPSLEDAVVRLARDACFSTHGWPDPEIKNIREHRYKWTAEILHCTNAASPRYPFVAYTVEFDKEVVLHTQKWLLFNAMQRSIKWKPDEKDKETPTT
jgi:hypothetical protein